MIYELIAVERGHFYVCGDCKMAENVYQTLKSIIQEQTGMNSTQSDNFMLGLRVSSRVAIYGNRKCSFFYFLFYASAVLRFTFKRYRIVRIISFSHYTIVIRFRFDRAPGEKTYPSYAERKELVVKTDSPFSKSWSNVFHRTVGRRKNKRVWRHFVSGTHAVFFLSPRHPILKFK